jgi:hypothetical protein
MEGDLLVLDFSLAMEQVRVLLESSVWMEGDLLVLDFSLAMEQVRVLLESSVWMCRDTSWSWTSASPWSR